MTHSRPISSPMRGAPALAKCSLQLTLYVVGPVQIRFAAARGWSPLLLTGR